MTASDLQSRPAPSPIHGPAHSPDQAAGRSAPGHLRNLTRAECEAWVAGHDEARLGFDTGRGHRSVVVGYAVRADEVVLLLPEYHPATGYLLGAPVTIEVEASLSGGSWESVRVSGVAYPGDASEVTSLHPYGGGWPPGVATHPVHVPLSELEGVVRAA